MDNISARSVWRQITSLLSISSHNLFSPQPSLLTWRNYSYIAIGRKFASARAGQSIPVSNRPDT